MFGDIAHVKMDKSAREKMIETEENLRVGSKNKLGLVCEYMEHFLRLIIII